MLIGIGTDIFALGRLSPAAADGNDPFFRRAYTPAEQEEAALRSNRREYLAGRFAAKEAVYKAVSLCGAEFAPGDIQITEDKDGRPQALLLGKTKARFEEQYGPRYRIHISVSHEDDCAIAFAVAEQDERSS